MLNEITEKVEERHELQGLVIGEKIYLQEIVSATLRALVDLKREKVSERLERYESKRMIDLGKLKLLEEIEEWI